VIRNKKKVWEEIFLDESAKDIVDSIKNLGTVVLDIDDESIHVVKVKLKRGQHLYVLYLGDLHIGHNEFSHNYLMKVLTIAKRMVDNGDNFLFSVWEITLRQTKTLLPRT